MNSLSQTRSGDHSPDEAVSKTPIPRRIWSIRLLVSILLLGATVVLALLSGRWRELGFDWGEFQRTIRRVDLLWVFLAFAVGLAAHLGRALRWRILMRPVKKAPGLWNLFSATVIGFSCVAVFGRPGELVRPYLIARKEHVAFSSQVAAWMIERLYDIVTTMLIFGIALSRLQRGSVQLGPRAAWVLETGAVAAVILGSLSLAVLILCSRFSAPFERWLSGALAFFPERIRGRMTGGLAAFARGVEICRGPGFISSLAIYSLFEWALVAGANRCVLQAFAGTAGFGLIDTVVFVGFVAFGSSLQIPGVGGGVQVVSAVALTEVFGASLETAGGVALMLWLTMMATVPAGALLAFHEGLSWSRLRQIEGEADL